MARTSKRHVQRPPASHSLHRRDLPAISRIQESIPANDTIGYIFEAGMAAPFSQPLFLPISQW